MRRLAACLRAVGLAKPLTAPAARVTGTATLPMRPRARSRSGSCAAKTLLNIPRYCREPGTSPSASSVNHAMASCRPARCWRKPGPRFDQPDCMSACRHEPRAGAGPSAPRCRCPAPPGALARARRLHSGATQPALSRLEAGGVIPPSRCSTGSPSPWTPYLIVEIAPHALTTATSVVLAADAYVGVGAMQGRRSFRSRDWHAEFMILPKIRDPRLVTLRRGGTLTDADHRRLALWAAQCAEHVLHFFEESPAMGSSPAGRDRGGACVGSRGFEDDGRPGTRRTRDGRGPPAAGVRGMPPIPPVRQPA